MWNVMSDMRVSESSRKEKKRERKEKTAWLCKISAPEFFLQIFVLSFFFFFLVLFFPKRWVCDWFFPLCSYQRAINHKTNSPNFSQPGLHWAKTNKVKQAKRNTCLLAFYAPHVPCVWGFCCSLSISVAESKCTALCMMWRDVTGCFAVLAREWKLTCWRVWDNHTLSHAETEKDEGGTSGGGGGTAAGLRLWAAGKQINGFNLNVETFGEEDDRWHLRPCHVSRASVEAESPGHISQSEHEQWGRKWALGLCREPRD